MSFTYSLRTAIGMTAAFAIVLAFQIRASTESRQFVAEINALERNVREIVTTDALHDLDRYTSSRVEQTNMEAILQPIAFSDLLRFQRRCSVQFSTQNVNRETWRGTDYITHWHDYCISAFGRTLDSRESQWTGTDAYSELLREIQQTQ